MAIIAQALLARPLRCDLQSEGLRGPPQQAAHAFAYQTRDDTRRIQLARLETVATVAR